VPPPELVGQWLCSDDYPWGPLEQSSITITTNRLQNVATQAAQWGADRELEACCEWFICDWTNIEIADKLRAARRPKPLSLKEQALKELRQLPVDPELGVCASALDTIRRALEALDD
jgi:hypothetical protein